MAKRKSGTRCDENLFAPKGKCGVRNCGCKFRRCGAYLKRDGKCPNAHHHAGSDR